MLADEDIRRNTLRYCALRDFSTHGTLGEYVMRKFILLLVLIGTQSCGTLTIKVSEESKWYVLNREDGCQSMTEAHESWPFLDGYWTPSALYNAVNSNYHDAKLKPFEAPGERVEASKQFTESNAVILSSQSGDIELPLLTENLCKGLGIMPVEPAQWLSVPSHIQPSESEYALVPSENWYQVNVTMLKHATKVLKTNGFIEIYDDAGKFYAGPHYMHEEGKRSYLVRGLYTGDGGHHVLFYKDGVLFVVYRGMGWGNGENPLVHFSPLIVNLPGQMKSVVVQINNL